MTVSNESKIYKEKIAGNFGRSTGQYDQYAIMQQQSAQALARYFPTLAEGLPVGPVLEIGCGTGGLSRELIVALPGRKVELTDLSPAMVDQCRYTLESSVVDLGMVTWRTMDAEAMSVRDRYACIVSGVTLQWFVEPQKTLQRLVDALCHGGRLLCSYISNDSFPEWRELCRKNGVDCTVNRLPEGEEISGFLRQMGLVRSWSECMEVSYNSAGDFFSSLKRTGANTARQGRSLTVAQMKRLINSWNRESGDGPVRVTYVVQYLLFSK